jgi:hypothetical protein
MLLNARSSNLFFIWSAAARRRFGFFFVETWCRAKQKSKAASSRRTPNEKHLA